ncbi:MAG: hypothetical protein IKA64_05165, partial [Clostridia bacterium]|nr:hypothetical protein [Clostridia bacterium]
GLGHARGLTVHRTVIQYPRAATLLACGLGHARGLTVHRTVIQYPRAATLPERAKELSPKAEATAKAKYERLKKLVEFYNV